MIAMKNRLKDPALVEKLKRPTTPEADAPPPPNLMRKKTGATNLKMSKSVDTFLIDHKAKKDKPPDEKKGRRSFFGTGKYLT